MHISNRNYRRQVGYTTWITDWVLLKTCTITTLLVRSKDDGWIGDQYTWSRWVVLQVAAPDRRMQHKGSSAAACISIKSDNDDCCKFEAFKAGRLRLSFPLTLPPTRMHLSSMKGTSLFPDHHLSSSPTARRSLNKLTYLLLVWPQSDNPTTGAVLFKILWPLLQILALSHCSFDYRWVTTLAQQIGAAQTRPRTNPTPVAHQPLQWHGRRWHN